MANIKIVFFASLREAMKCDELELLLETPLTILQIKQRLAEELGQSILLEEKVKALFDLVNKK